MRSTRIYVEQALSVNNTVTLTEKAHHHLAVVLRARLNDIVVLFNGDGFEYSGVISAISKKNTQIHLTLSNANLNESPLHLHLGQCISQNNRFDFAVQKACEMGVSTLTPIISDHSQKMAKPQLTKRMGHWQQVAINAAEQSHRAVVPTIQTPIALSEWLNMRDEDEKWVCAIGGKTPTKSVHNINRLALLIGPEGGLSKEEVRHSIDHGFKTIAIGNRVLRTETAPIAAISLAQFFWGDASSD